MGEPSAAGECEIQLTTPPPPPACAICMEPWTCNSDHRICCIPCGHVYGRSCLEKWLDRSGPDSAKCPQCSDQFRLHDIINLFAPGNLWDGCCRIQELKERSVSILKGHSIKCELRILEMREEALADIEKRRATEYARYEEMWALSEQQRVALRELMMAEVKFLSDGMDRAWEEKASMVANLKSVKEQMKKMAREENTTAADVVEFMERSFPQLSQISYPPFSAAASAASTSAAPAPAVDYENARGRLNRLLMRPIPAPAAGPSDGVKRKRHRET